VTDGYGRDEHHLYRVTLCIAQTMPSQGTCLSVMIRYSVRTAQPITDILSARISLAVNNIM